MKFSRGYATRAVNVMSVSVCVCVCVCVCLCVCLYVPACVSVSPLMYLENHKAELIKYFVHVACGRGTVFLWQLCDTLCTSGFVMTSYFHIMGLMARHFPKRH